MAKICRVALGCIFSLAMSYSASAQGDPAPLAAAKAAAEKASQDLAAAEKAAKEAKKKKFAVRYHNRCKRCGRPRGFLRKFQLCRICFRQLSLSGEVPGVVKSSW